jgi:hypothetical protein
MIVWPYGIQSIESEQRVAIMFVSLLPTCERTWIQAKHPMPTFQNAVLVGHEQELPHAITVVIQPDGDPCTDIDKLIHLLLPKCAIHDVSINGETCVHQTDSHGARPSQSEV